MSEYTVDNPVQVAKRSDFKEEHILESESSESLLPSYSSKNILETEFMYHGREERDTLGESVHHYESIPTTSQPNTKEEEDTLQKESKIEQTETTDDSEEPSTTPEEYTQDLFRDNDELTFRAVFVGCILGALVAAMNVNFGLRTGWSNGGAIFSALVTIAIFKIIKPRLEFTRYETVIAVTCASSAGTMTSAAGLISSIPALKLLGFNYSVWQLYLWALSLAFFGVYFAQPLRQQMIVHENLRFPSGTVTGETIKALYSKGSSAMQRATVLIVTATATACYSLVSFFIPVLQDPPMPKLLHDWGFTLHISPLLFGGGMLSGFRSAGSIMLGSIIGWAIVGPIVQHNGLVTGPVLSFSGVRGWILWIGVAIMTTDALVQVVFSVKYLFHAIVPIVQRINAYMKSRKTKQSKQSEGLIPSEEEEVNEKIREQKSKLLQEENVSLEEQEEEAKVTAAVSKQTREISPLRYEYVPYWWCVIGLIFSTILVSIIGHFVFDIKFYFVWMALPLAALLCLVAVRCVGETDINPIGGVAKVTQLLFAVFAPGEMVTNLLSAGICAAGSSQGGDMMQDFKMGYVVRVGPRKQFIAQCIGIFFGILFCIPVYKLFDTAYEIGGPDLPAPAAHSWKAVAQILAKGLDALPNQSQWGILGGCIFSFILAMTSRILGCINPTWPHYLPSNLAIGIGMIIPPKQSISILIGALVYWGWKFSWPKQSEKYYFSVASGLVSGEGLMSIFIAALKIFKLKPLIPPYPYY